MLALSKKSLAVRYAYSWSDKYRHTGPPDAASLCGFFWRCVISTAIVTAPIIMLGFALFVIAIKTYDYFWGPPKPEIVWTPPTYGDSLFNAIVMGVVAVFMFSVTMYKWLDAYPDGWLGTIFWAVKRRVCPIIELQGTSPAQDDAMVRSQEERETLTKLRNIGLVAGLDDDGEIEVTTAKPLWGEFYRAQEALGPEWLVAGVYADDKATLTITRREVGVEA